MQNTAIKSILMFLCIVLNTILIGTSIYYFIILGKQKNNKVKKEEIKIWIVVFVYSIINVMAVLMT